MGDVLRPAAPGTRSRARRRRGGRGRRRASPSRWRAAPRTAVTTSRIARSGGCRSMPTFVRQRVPPRADDRRMPARARGRRASRTSLASRAGLRRPDVDDPGADLDPLGRRGGTPPSARSPSRTRRLSACHTASKPGRLGLPGELHALADVVGVLEVEGDGEVGTGHDRILPCVGRAGPRACGRRNGA